MVRMSLIRAEDVVRYARWLSELINGRVEVQSRARRSYRAVVMPTDALLTFGILKLTSLILRDKRRWVVTRTELFVVLVRRLVEGIADGNEGVGRTAGRKRTRVGERLQIIYVVGRAMLNIDSVKGRGLDVICCCHVDQRNHDQ